nr:hypothetical protein PELCBEBN_00022 [Escherichia coli str. K-12 substr. MG1655]
MDSARALIARGWGVSLVSRCLRVSRAQLHVILRRTDDWMDGRRSRHTDDTDVLLRIHHVIGELPTYGYRRVWALLRRQAELDGMPAINAKRVYRIMRQNALLLERKPAVPPSKRAHTGRVAVKEGVVCGRGRNPTLRLWPTIFSGKIDVFPGDRRSRLISSMTSVAPA